MAEDTPPESNVLWDTVPFGILHRLHERIRKWFPFRDFRDNFKELFDGEKIPEIETSELDLVLPLLYERVVDARVEIAWVRSLRRFRRSAAWKGHVAGVERSVRASRDLQEAAKRIRPKFLQPTVSQAFTQLNEALPNLTHSLAESQRWNDRMESISKLHNERSARRVALLAMDRTLRRHCPKLHQDQRVAMIRIAVEAGKLKEEETVLAILEVLKRHRRKTSKTTKAKRK